MTFFVYVPLNQGNAVLKISKVYIAWKYSYAKRGPNTVQKSPQHSLVDLFGCLSLEILKALASLKLF